MTPRGRAHRGVRASVIALMFAIPSFATADYLEVRRAAVLRAEPNSGAQAIRPAIVGEHLPLADSGLTDFWYHVELSGTLGGAWIYRSFVRRHAGGVPAAPSSAAPSPTPMSGTSRHYRLGKPVALYERVRDGYALEADGRLKIPLWVQYELTREDLSGPPERSDDFRPDVSIPNGFRAELADYRGSGFDRGHMAPAADMRRSETVQSESFLLTNMCPQNATLNRGLWADLEAAVRGWVEQRGPLIVIGGPVFGAQGGRIDYRVLGERRVAIPTHFFKIVVDARAGQPPQALAFLIANAAPTDRDLGRYLVSIDEIEGLAGIDFLPALADGEEDSIELVVAPGLW